MAPRLICCLCLALGMAFLAVRAEAGDRRSDAGGQKAEMAVARRSVAELNAGAHAAHSANHGGPEVASLTFAKTTATTAAPAQTAKEPERNEGQGQRKTITFFRFNNSRVREVSVQPVVGRVNGAQLSIGF